MLVCFSLPFRLVTRFPKEPSLQAPARHHCSPLWYFLSAQAGFGPNWSECQQSARQGAPQSVKSAELFCRREVSWLFQLKAVLISSSFISCQKPLKAGDRSKQVSSLPLLFFPFLCPCLYFFPFASPL